MPLLSPETLLSPYLLLGDGSDHPFAAGKQFHKVNIKSPNNIIGGAARILIAPYSHRFPESIGDIINLDETHKLYDPQPGWIELGATKDGVSLSSQHLTSKYIVDRSKGEINQIPTGYEIKVSTKLAQINSEALTLLWKSGKSEYNELTEEEKLNIGKNSDTPLYRVAILIQKEDGRIRAHVLRRAYPSFNESSINYSKGQLSTVDLVLEGTCDTACDSYYSMYGAIYNQLPVIKIKEELVPEDPLESIAREGFADNTIKVIRNKFEPRLIKGVTVKTEKLLFNKSHGFLKVKGAVFDSDKNLVAVTNEEVFSNNLLSNPLFTAATNYSSNGSSIVVRESSGGYIGNNCLKVTTTSSHKSGIVISSVLRNRYFSPNFVTVSAHIKGESGGETIKLEASFRDHNFNEIATSVSPDKTLLSSYNRYAFTTNIPEGTHSVYLKIYNHTHNVTFYVDAVMATIGPKIRPFFETTLPLKTYVLPFPQPVSLTGNGYMGILSSTKGGDFNTRSITGINAVSKNEQVDASFEEGLPYDETATADPVGASSELSIVEYTGNINNNKELIATTFHTNTNFTWSNILLGVNNILVSHPLVTPFPATKQLAIDKVLSDGSDIVVFDAGSTAVPSHILDAAYELYNTYGKRVITAGNQTTYSSGNPLWTGSVNTPSTLSPQVVARTGHPIEDRWDTGSDTNARRYPTGLRGTVKVHGYFTDSSSGGTLRPALISEEHPTNGGKYVHCQMQGVPSSQTKNSIRDWFQSDSGFFTNKALRVKHILPDATGTTTAYINGKNFPCSPDDNINISVTFRPVYGIFTSVNLIARYHDFNGNFLQDVVLTTITSLQILSYSEFITLNENNTAPSNAYSVSYQLKFNGVNNKKQLGVDIAHRQIVINPPFSTGGIWKTGYTPTGKNNLIANPNTDDLNTLGTAHRLTAEIVSDPDVPSGKALKLSNNQVGSALFVPNIFERNNIPRGNSLLGYPGAIILVTGWIKMNEDAWNVNNAAPLTNKSTLVFNQSPTGGNLQVNNIHPPAPNQWHKLEVYYSMPSVDQIRQLVFALGNTKLVTGAGVNPITWYSGMRLEYRAGTSPAYRGLVPDFNEGQEGVYKEDGRIVSYNDYPVVVPYDYDSPPSVLDIPTSHPKGISTKVVYE